MVSAGGADNAAGVPEFEAIPEASLGNPQWYRDESRRILGGQKAGTIKPLDAQRQLDTIAKACPIYTGRTMEDVAKEKVDPLVRFTSLMDAGEKELVELETAISHIDELRAGAGVKKKWLNLIARTRRAQGQCRPDPAKAWVYIGREDAQAGFFRMAPCHLGFFDTWNDAEAMNSLTEAPPGHAKTTCLRGLTVWEIGTFPHLRFLLLYDNGEKATKEIVLLKNILRSGRFRALFPDVRVLDRKDGARCNSEGFTVCRTNEFTREPTVEGAGMQSRINGNGYNRIHADDICPPEVRWQPTVRRALAATWFSVVEERIRDHPTVRARIRLICTPWHEEDIAGLIEKDVQAGRLPNWTVNIDANRIRDDQFGRAIPIWDKGGMFNPEYFETKKRWPQRYNCNYKLNARLDTGRALKFIQFYNSRADDVAGEHDLQVLQAIAQSERWLSIDPAATAGEKRHSSRSGAIEAVLTQRGYAFITNAWLHALGPVELEEWVVERICTAPAPGYAWLLIEANAAMKYGVSLTVKNITEAVTKRGVRMPQVFKPEVTFGRRVSMSKEQRLNECAGYLQNGLVRFAGQRTLDRQTNHIRLQAIPNSSIEELRDLLLNFDGGTQGADVIDAVTQFILVNADRIADPANAHLAAAVVQPGKPPSALLQSWRDELLRLQRPEEEEDAELAMLRAKYGRRERISA